MTEFTADTFFNGQITVRQSVSGYRFSIDAVILANLAAIKPGDRILDMGTGCGIIPMIIAYRHPEIASIFGVDLQKDLAEIAGYNVRQNRMVDRITILHADFKMLTPGHTQGPVDLVIGNPPHYPPNSGRINPDTQRALARHEIAMTLADFMETARRMLGRGGRLLIIYPAERLVDLLNEMRWAGIEPQRLQLIYPRPGAEARLVVAEGIAGKRPAFKISPPLYIHDADGNYTPEIKVMFSPDRQPTTKSPAGG